MKEKINITQEEYEGIIKNMTEFILDTLTISIPIQIKRSFSKRRMEEILVSVDFFKLTETVQYGAGDLKAMLGKIRRGGK